MSAHKQKLRPMGIADILDETVELYKTNFLLLVGIAAFVYVPYSILERYAMSRYALALATSTSFSAASDMTDIILMIGTLLISYAYLLITTPLMTGALTYAISERYLDRKITIIESYKRVFGASIFGKLMCATLVKIAVVIISIILLAIIAAVNFATIAVAGKKFGVIIEIVTVLFVLAAVIAMIYLILRLALLETSIVIEKKKIGDALSRTWDIMQGNIGKCFWLYLIGGIVTAIVSWICSVPTHVLVMSTAFAGGHSVQAVLLLHTAIGAISSTILAPIMSIVVILLYYDIRVRREGFDLEWLANELGEKIAVQNAQMLPQEQSASEPTQPGDSFEE